VISARVATRRQPWAKSWSAGEGPGKTSWGRRARAATTNVVASRWADWATAERAFAQVKANVSDPANSPAVPPPAQRPPLYLDTWTHNKIGNRELYLNDLISIFSERLYLQGGIRRTNTDRANLNRVTGTFPSRRLNPPRR